MSGPLIITGMHRSGTSLVANYLQRCGLDLGDELLPADPGNRFGYYEDRSINAFHRELLDRSGVTDGFSVSEDDLPVPFTEDDVERARSMASRHQRPDRWGFKEPRTALFLDLWERATPKARVLFIFRHPLAVLDSLLRRGTNATVNDRPVTGLEMWRLYNSEMIRYARKHANKTMWCETARFVQDPRALTGPLRDRFGLELDTASLDEVFDDSAYHHEVRGRARFVATRHRREAKVCMDLYAELQLMAEHRG